MLFVTVHGANVPFYVIARPAFGPPTADGNLNRYILDCFVVKLLAMTPATQLIRRERLLLFILDGPPPAD